MRQLLTAILVLCFAAPSLADDEVKKPEQPDWEFKFKAARTALKKYDADIVGLDKRSERERKKLEDEQKNKRKTRRVELIMDLEKALAEVTKEGKLDDAVKIRDEITFLRTNQRTPPPKPEKAKRQFGDSLMAIS